MFDPAVAFSFANSCPLPITTSFFAELAARLDCEIEALVRGERRDHEVEVFARFVRLACRNRYRPADR